MLLFLLSGCVIKHTPQPYDTNFNPADRDWIEIYKKEIEVAIENDDYEAWSFFWREYMLEKTKLKNCK